jgi:magnesium chelatase family protein
MNPPSFDADPREMIRFRKKLSGAIIDRIDMWVEVPHVPHEKLAGKEIAERSSVIRERIHAARAKQQERCAALELDARTNSEISPKMLDARIGISNEAVKTLVDASKRLKLSPRSYHRVLRLARTIADLSGEKEAGASHVFEGLQYRPRISHDL